MIIIGMVYPETSGGTLLDRDAVTLMITGRESITITWRAAQRVRKILNDWVSLGLADYAYDYGYGLRGDVDTTNARLAALLETIQETVIL